jgi:hypothetical protein
MGRQSARVRLTTRHPELDAVNNLVRLRCNRCRMRACTAGFKLAVECAFRTVTRDELSGGEEGVGRDQSKMSKAGAAPKRS